MCRKTCTEHSFSWHATFPPDTFVPPHIHPDQDEYLYILEGKLDFFLDGAETQATPGDLVRLPMGKPHGIFNKSGQTAKTLFWVSPTRRLYDLFWGIHNMKEQNAGRRRGARRRAQHPLPAAASGGVSYCPREARIGERIEAAAVLRDARMRGSIRATR